MSNNPIQGTMKTRFFTYMKALLLATIMVGFSSCEVELEVFFDTDQNSELYYSRSYTLCNRTWVDYYYDSYGNRCRQEVAFFLDRTGIDRIRTEYPNGDVYIDEFSFKWRWENYDQTSIRMAYGPGDVSRLEGIHLRTNSLSGYLDGWDNYVEYTGR